MRSRPSVADLVRPRRAGGSRGADEWLTTLNVDLIEGEGSATEVLRLLDDCTSSLFVGRMLRISISRWDR
jgi:hypothetical protein